MCFAPQRRALFRHLNFQKWSDHGVFLTFWLGNVLRATTACTFLTSQLPKVVRRWCVLYILTSKCASRHNGVHFFISHLASWLRTRRFSEPTFRPSGAPNHWKNTVFHDFPTFSRICIFFLLTLSLLIFSLLIFLFSLPPPCSAFHLSILSEVWLLNFLRIDYFTFLKMLLSARDIIRFFSNQWHNDWHILCSVFFVIPFPYYTTSKQNYLTCPCSDSFWSNQDHSGGEEYSLSNGHEQSRQNVEIYTNAVSMCFLSMLPIIACFAGGYGYKQTRLI